jgi:hypothetical protein
MTMQDVHAIETVPATATAVEPEPSRAAAHAHPARPGVAARAGRAVLRVLSSIGLSFSLLVMLGILTWLGTLEQVEHGLFEVQKKYFDSFVLVHDFGPLAVPLPGANLVLSILFLNLLIGGVIRLRKSIATAGILVGHIGILILLAAGFVKLYYSEEGHVTLYEGESASHFQSYHRWELVVVEDLRDGTAREHIVPQEDFLDATTAVPRRLESAALPFALEVRHVMPNCQPLPKGPMFDVPVPVVEGVFLRAEEKDPTAEFNVAGAYVTVVQRDGARQEGILWGAERSPMVVRADGKDWMIGLRHERYPMNLTLKLDDFRKEDHPRMGLAKSFESDVTVREDGTTRGVKISMNEPLRSAGLVLYQASWGPSNAKPGDDLFSTFAVVRNPSDQMPLIGCIVIALGLVFHFGRKLVRHVRLEARKA